MFNKKKSKKTVAVKKLFNEADMNAFIAEASILKQLRHTKIVQFLGIFKGTDGIFMVTEFSKKKIK